MRTLIFTLVYFLMSFNTGYSQHKESVLVFTKTAGYRHSSIPKGVSTIKALLNDAHIDMLHTEDVRYFSQDSLSRFDAIIFLSTSGDLFSEDQKKSFQDYIRSGKGYVGIHAASTTEYNWPWYGQLVGGYFSVHPEVQEAEIEVLNRNHSATRHMQDKWFHRDEWYDFKDVKHGLNILMTVNEESYKGGKMGKFHPIAWFQEFDGGRSFYTALGHTDESYDEDNFQKHILGGLFWVLNRK